MALILDQILISLFMEKKKSQIYYTYIAQVAKLVQYLLACNSKLCSVTLLSLLV